MNPVQQHRRLHVANHRHGLVRPAAPPAAVVFLVALVREAPLELPGEEAIEALVEVEREGADEGGEVPGAGVGVVAEVGEVEDLGAALHGVEDLDGEIGVPILEDAEDEHEGFEGDDPVTGFADAPGDGLGAGGCVRLVRRNERENFLDVLVFDGNDVVGGGFEDGDLEVGGVGVGDLGKAYARLVFHCPNCLLQLAWHC